MSGSPRCGVLLANLGTPDAPTPAAVRRFLAEFLSDRRVVDYPRLLWWPILHGVVLRARPKRSAHAYAQIWTERGSPLLIESRALAQALQTALGQEAKVALGMTYGSPSIAEALRSMPTPLERLVVIPLYPQYSTTTTAAVFDRVEAELRRWPTPVAVHRIEHYYHEPAYLDALAASIRAHWARHERKHLLFSFHGIPKRYVTKGDPYYEHCIATARETAARFELNRQQWSFAFQSRVGPGWLEPYTDQLLLKYAQTGPRDVAVVCPAFATDCLETLEEIAIRNRDAFLAAGGRSFDYIPCLNAQPLHVEMFASLVRRRIAHSGQSPVVSSQ